MLDRLSFGPLGALSKQKLTTIGCVLAMISIGFMFRKRMLIGTTRNWPTQTMIAARPETPSSETNRFFFSGLQVKLSILGRAKSIRRCLVQGLHGFMSLSVSAFMKMTQDVMLAQL